MNLIDPDKDQFVGRLPGKDYSAQHAEQSSFTGAQLEAALAAERKLIARRIVSAFDGVDWTKHSFNLNGVIASTASGERQFYEVGQVDSGVARLNSLVTELKA